MIPTDLCEYLSRRTYPGRGILLGKSADGRFALISYFIMGRSENSRNRVFVPRDGGIVTEAADPGKMTDPSLILYAPVRLTDAYTTLVTNGDQTDTIAQHLAQGGSFETALRTRTFEPDAPNFTPRISAILRAGEGHMAYRMSILKSDGGGTAVQRFFFEYDAPLAGEGRLLHTYEGDGDPLPSFTGEPVPVRLPLNDLDDLAAAVWHALDNRNRISLFVRAIDLATGQAETRILNQRG